MEDLFSGGYFRQAYDLGLSMHGPLETWPDQIMAAHLAAQVGSPRTAYFLLLRNARRHKDNLKALLSLCRWTARRQGTWFGYHQMESHRALFEAEPDPQVKIDWLCQKAEFLATFRDFDRAHRALEEARSVGVESREIATAGAHILRAQDLPHESLAMLDEALSTDPRNWEWVFLRATLLRRLNREDESLQYLTKMEPQFESAVLSTVHIGYCTEHEAFQEALEAIERYRARYPLSDKTTDRILQEQRFLCDYRLGHYGEAESYLGNHPRPSHRTLLENLKRSRPEDKRVSLKVKNVRQAHSTCGPATIAIVTQYWGNPASQEEVAREICYDGTSFLAHRRWAESNGWTAREFTVDWDTTRALIDAGVPFTMVTAEVDSAHVQVVHGYDEKLGLLCVTDPSLSFEVEMLAEKAFERWAFIGPRGIAICPADKSDLLLEIPLPDSDLYDLAHEMERRLDDDNRARAEQAFQKLNQAAPGHLVTLQAEYALALYDRDLSRAIESNGQILNRYPLNPSLVYQQQALLAKAGREKARTTLLAQAIEQTDCPPALNALLATELIELPPEWPRAEQLLNDSLALSDSNANLHGLLGELRFKQKRALEGLQLKRFAACLEPRKEPYSRDYFASCLPLGKAEEGLEFLTARYHTLGEQRSQAGQTLCMALEEVGRFGEARELLEELVERFPEDSELLLFALDRFAACGQLERLEELTERHRGASSELEFLRGKAKLHAYKGEPQKELEHWLLIARLEPSAHDAYSGIVGCYEKLGQPEKAVAFMEDVCQRYPHNFILQKMLFAVVADSMSGDPVSVLRSIVEAFPKDAWSWRHLALQLGRSGEEAMEKAAALDSESMEYHRALTEWHLRCGRPEQAKAACRAAIATDLVNSLELVNQLVEMATNTSETREELDFVWKQLEEHRDYPGDALFLYQALAKPYFEPQELLTKIQQFNKGRHLLPSDLAAEIKQTLRAGHHESALSKIEQAVVEYPFHLGHRLLLADIHRDLGDPEKEHQALQEALKLAPTSGSVLRRLSDLAWEAGHLEEAVSLLQQALASHPGDSQSRNRLAELYWLQEHREEAIESLKLTLRLAPQNPWGWKTLLEWAGPEQAIELAQRLTEERPRDQTSWLNLYQMLPITSIDESRAALERAMEIAPLDEDIHLAMVQFYLSIGRFQEALAACRPEVFEGKPPRRLRLEECLVKRQMGQHRESMVDLRALLESESHFVQAWNYLAHWSMGSEQLQAAEKLVELEPRESTYYVLLGCIQAVNKLDPREAFRTALRFDPLSDTTVMRLLESSHEYDQPKQLQADLDEFGRVLSKGDRAYYDWLSSTLSMHEKRMFDKLQSLALNPELEVGLERAYHYLSSKDRDTVLVEALGPLGESGRGSWRAGSYYAKAFARMQGDKNLDKALLKIPSDCAFYSGMLGDYVRSLSEWGFKKYLSKNEKLLKSHTYPWSVVLSRLLPAQNADYKRAVEWSDDWQDREGVESWALFNRSIALRALGRWEEAYALDVWMEENLEFDSLSASTQLNLAFEELAKGDTQLAGLRLQRAGKQEGLHYQFLETLLRGALLADRGHFKEARTTISQANKIVRPLAWAPWQRRCQTVASKFVYEQSGDFITKLWYIKQLFLRDIQLGMFLLWISIAVIGKCGYMIWEALP